MNFTKEEREKLIANGKAIEKYIREHIMPQLRDTVRVDFGNHRDPYALWVSKNELAITQGNLSLSFEDHIYQTGEVSLYNPGHGHAALYELCLNWRHTACIKFHLMDARDKQAILYEKVFENFKV